MQNTARILTFAVLILGVVITISIMVHAARGCGFLLSLVTLVFAAWAMIPYVVLFHSSRLQTSFKVSWFILLSALGIVGLGVYIYIDAFFIHIDPQSGLVFIFVPLYQLILAGIIFAIARLSSPSINSGHETKA